LFTQVVRDDLQFSGILDLVSPSFYPTTVPTTPTELRNDDWITPQINANLVAFGNLTESASEVVISGWLYDVRSPSTQAVVGKVYRGTPTDAQVRKFAHQFADEIISRLSGGLPGIASTQIAFVSSRTGTKEIWVMDYDGANQHPLTSLHTISLTPRWSPDASRIAFTCFVPGATGVVSPQICMYSTDANKVVSFARFRGSSSAPAWSPDGSQIMFSSSMLGNPELFVTDANGGRPKRLTYSTAASTSPTWNPKTGQSVVFVSDRGGIPKLYMMNADGTNTTELDLPDKGYLIDPAWSPNGQMVAFSWRRPDGNFDIYIMEPATVQIIQITRDSGKNERPSWAPDGRHIVFESTRNGERQIWTMLADGTQAHELTMSGHNESPNWSPK
jgi:TolB protein